MNTALIAAFIITGGGCAAVFGGTARIAIRARLHKDDPAFRPRAVRSAMAQASRKARIGAGS